jgi:hypothetical protein
MLSGATAADRFRDGWRRRRPRRPSSATLSAALAAAAKLAAKDDRGRGNKWALFAAEEMEGKGKERANHLSIRDLFFYSLLHVFCFLKDYNQLQPKALLAVRDVYARACACVTRIRACVRVRDTHVQSFKVQTWSDPPGGARIFPTRCLGMRTI